ncbi:hypothetical protein CONCODRAFT_9593 [Conidiobolus coronatus NRRL 28638]|uniref:Uncharacterized protein n=1 Tax=Conidiobolus coronatus (strain ATCC 28846 / CBS 209.66 / NRRL 28638) TaxID=796925 RepID=A0A137NZE6_CONC2|nr:hypothetical protein CONCODRAFT_9593 [Conidiobolus coronatus NRRL 28638]|eukprot:KXN68210.1 hypothetical protein CONCODRAFT_9593 [Conidiobolus coronatus NRRL 28638]
MGKKNASLLILSGFIFIYFISLIYIPSNLFNLNAQEYRLKFNKFTDEEYFEFNGGEGGRKFNSLRCSNWNKCTMLDVVMKKGDQRELKGKELEPEFYIEQLKVLPSQTSLITQNKIKLIGIPYKILKLDSSSSLPRGIDIILSYTINNNDQEINYFLTTIEGTEVKNFNITGGLKVEDIFLTSESLLITR